MMNRAPEHYDNWQRELFENLPSEWKLAKAQFLVQRQVRDVLEIDDVVTVFRDGEVTLRTNRRTDGFTFADKEIGYHHVEPGDLAIHKMDGGFGAIGISDSAGKVSPVVNLYRSDNFDLRFVSYFLRTAVAAGYVKSLQKGIRERSIEFDHAQFSDFYLPLPDLDTQRRIADYLDKETAQIDTLVAELDGYVELLEKRNTQLVDHYISGEPVSLNLLSTYFDCVHTTPESDEYGEFESVRTSSIRSGKFVQGQGITVSEETYKTRNRDISPEAGDLFFTREAPAGESCLVPESNTYCAGQRVVTIRPNREKILPSYLLWALNSSIAQDFFRLRSTGSTVGNIKMDTIGQVKIPVPEISEQRKIVKEIEKHLGRTDALIKECRELKEILLKRRQVLITDVVTGKVEV